MRLEPFGMRMQYVKLHGSPGATMHAKLPNQKGEKVGFKKNKDIL